MMLDPASSKLANIQGLIELQGITNVPIIQERLEMPEKLYQMHRHNYLVVTQIWQ